MSCRGSLYKVTDQAGKIQPKTSGTIGIKTGWCHARQCVDFQQVTIIPGDNKICPGQVPASE
jgi:hypothetical protein